MALGGVEIGKRKARLQPRAVAAAGATGEMPPVASHESCGLTTNDGSFRRKGTEKADREGKPEEEKQNSDRSGNENPLDETGATTR